MRGLDYFAADYLGEVPVDPPDRGVWPWRHFFDIVRHVDGRVFVRSKIFAWPFYDGVRAQYREARDRFAAHLFVRDDWTYEINHLDEDNPDRGRWPQHFFNDTPPGKVIKAAAPYVAVGLIALALLNAFSGGARG
jgi:hypothetical protein